MINNSSDYSHFEMYVIDGQNHEQIQQYQRSDNTNKFNPCIPMIINDDKSISITFGDNIWKEWYPINICDHDNNTFGFQNEYLFDGGSYVILSVLIITDYIITQQRNYPILRSDIYYNSSITVNNGSITNINSSINKHLF